ncbi:MAG: glycoside hydrolase family 9 protein [Armatimonadetes bacterium]|nr:glycoside hydrolase family 9 protein [Armatimonadota bacterium]
MVEIMDLRSYRVATINGTKWLMTQQERDGSFKPVEHGLATCHKLPYALALMGEEERAARLCSWLVDHMMDEEGDFTRLYPRSNLMELFYNYPNAWLIAGAQKLGVYALSWPAAEFLSTVQHPETGGFLTAGPAASLSDEQDLLSTATAGLACLHIGASQAAVRAGDFLVWLLDKQPRSNALFTFVRDTDQLVEEPPSQELEPYYVFHVGRPGQFYAAPAMAALFLSKLYDATSNDDYLTAAQLYANFPESDAADRYTSVYSGLWGWAAAELFAATGNQNYLRTATEVGNALLEQQLENGSWLQASMTVNQESDVVDGTAEHIIVLRGITKALALGL